MFGIIKWPLYYILQFKTNLRMSYTKELLYSIADEMGRNRRDMDNFVAVLEKNWYDSKQSLRSLTIKDFDRFQIPSRLANMIMQKVGSGSNSQPSQIKNQPPPPKYQMMDIEQSLKDHIESMNRKMNRDMFGECIDTLLQLFRNIRSNLTNEKFRILKKSNKRIAQLISIPENAKILQYGGFRQEGELLTMQNINLGKIDQCIDTLSKYQQGPKFNPYEASVMSTVRNQPKIEGQSSVVFNDKLKQLEEQRMRIMSKPIKERHIKVFQQKKEEIKPDRHWYDERDATLEEKEYNDSVKEKLKHYGEESKFMNRRKQEYFELAKKPIFSETLVRVKLPDDWIFECVFSPMETLGDLTKIFDQFVEDKKLSYYLYMTPPVKKLTGMALRQTFYDAGCVPRAIFYFGSEETIKGNVLKVKKSIFESIFR